MGQMAKFAIVLVAVAVFTLVISSDGGNVTDTGTGMEDKMDSEPEYNSTPLSNQTLILMGEIGDLLSLESEALLNQDRSKLSNSSLSRLDLISATLKEETIRLLENDTLRLMDNVEKLDGEALSDSDRDAVLNTMTSTINNVTAELYKNKKTVQVLNTFLAEKKNETNGNDKKETNTDNPLMKLETPHMSENTETTTALYTTASGVENDLQNNTPTGNEMFEDKNDTPKKHPHIFENKTITSNEVFVDKKVMPKLKFSAAWLNHSTLITKKTMDTQEITFRIQETVTAEFKFLPSKPTKSTHSIDQTAEGAHNENGRPLFEINNEPLFSMLPPRPSNGTTVENSTASFQICPTPVSDITSKGNCTLSEMEQYCYQTRTELLYVYLPLFAMIFLLMVVFFVFLWVLINQIAAKFDEQRRLRAGGDSAPLLRRNNVNPRPNPQIVVQDMEMQELPMTEETDENNMGSNVFRDIPQASSPCDSSDAEAGCSRITTRAEVHRKCCAKDYLK